MKNMFMRKPEYRILGEVEDEIQLIAALEKKHPDILIIDPFQKDKFSIDTLVKVNERYPEMKLAEQEIIADVLGRTTIGGIFTKDQRDISINALPLHIMRGADHCGFGYFRMGHQGAFHFCCPHAVTGYVDHIIDPAGNPVIAVRVPPATVASEIFPVIS